MYLVWCTDRRLSNTISFLQRMNTCHSVTAGTGEVVVTFICFDTEDVVTLISKLLLPIGLCTAICYFYIIVFLFSCFHLLAIHVTANYLSRSTKMSNVCKIPTSLIPFLVIIQRSHCTALCDIPALPHLSPLFSVPPRERREGDDVILD